MPSVRTNRTRAFAASSERVGLRPRTKQIDYKAIANPASKRKKGGARKNNKHKRSTGAQAPATTLTAKSLTEPEPPSEQDADLSQPTEFASGSLIPNKINQDKFPKNFVHTFHEGIISAIETICNYSLQLTFSGVPAAEMEAMTSTNAPNVYAYTAEHALK
ncbi:hypothetical protein BDN70DRAFT_926206 [Pholiota conissans]|uniref:Uncharacterized protein n=1 Tax=Pholiota conissans TaxID=109636 RepID=A0A9P6CLK5_9AGAR|nr:hypothetical protein BDN70DRAFT_926206 [Pholiota conissans]